MVLLDCRPVNASTESESANPETADPFGGMPRVDRLGPEAIRIHWDLGPPSQILACDRPTASAAAAGIPAGELSAAGTRLDGYPAHQRKYFLLRPADGGPHRWVAERRLALDGQPNLRDLGGYASADGRTIRWGQLFRSGALAELSDADRTMLDDLELRVVCDFRTPLEREREPHEFSDHKPPEQIAVSREQLAGALQPDDMRERISSGNFDDLEIKTLLVDGNDAFATTHRSPFRNMIRIACEPENRPLMVNCTAGKDRAGFASAVLLMALGVPRPTIEHDYLLSGYFRREDSARKMEMLRAQLPPELDATALSPLFETRPAYIQAAFAAIDREWGSDTAFLTRGLEVSTGEIEALRDRFLE